MKRIKELALYQNILTESFGGVMYNVDNKEKYQNDPQYKFLIKSLESISINEMDGIMKGLYNFIK